MKSFIFNVYFLLTPYNTRDCYYFESNLRLTLLTKMFLTQRHIMLFCSILNMTIVCRKFELPPSINKPLYGHPHLFIFFLNPTISPSEIPDKHKNKLMWQSYFFIFRKATEKQRYMLFYKQHLAEI